MSVINDDILLSARETVL